MSFKRRKKKIRAYLLGLRRNGPTYTALSEAFLALGSSSFRDFLHWNYPRYKQSVIFSGMRTNNRANVGRWVRSNFSTPSEALRWVNGVVEYFSDDITENNAILSKVEDRYKNFNDIKSDLLFYFNKNPISLLNIGAILFFISKSEGLDSQKKWMIDNLFVKSGGIANVLHYFKGVASEGGRDPFEVMNIIYEAFTKHIQDDSLSNAIYDVIFGMPVTSERFANLQNYISYQSSIDQYEAAANLVSSNLIVLPQVSKHELSLFRSRMRNCRDWRSDPLDIIKSSFLDIGIYLPIHDRTSSEIPIELSSSYLNDLEDRSLRTHLADYYFGVQNSPSAYLASSHQVIRQSGSISEYLQGMSRRELAYAYYNEKDPTSCGRVMIPLKFNSVYTSLTDDVKGLERRELFRLACLLGIDEELNFDVLCLLYAESRNDSTSIEFFPSLSFFKSISDDDLVTYSYEPRIAIALSKIKDTFGEEADQILYLSVETFLTSRGVSRPSELNIENVIIENFLYEACTIECLERSLVFDTDNDIEEERLLILNLLEQLDNERKKIYESEIHKLVGRQTVNELLRTYDVGKIYCDERAIQNWAKDSLLAKFIRLRDHIESGLLPVELDSAQEFISHVSAGKPGAFIFRVPSNDAFNIARSIVEELLDRYALDPRHGIDSYLSLGMRHGALIDHLRSPLSHHHLVTTKGVLGYEHSEYWEHTFSMGGEADIGCEVSAAIAKFSDLYDSELRRIKDDLIQVRRKDRPFGIINLEWSEAQILSFISNIISLESFDQILEEFSAFYWSIADSKLDFARSEVLNNIKSNLFEMIYNLENNLTRNTGLARLGPFTDAVVRAKEELSKALDDLASWHHIAKSTEIESIALVDIISAAKKIVTRLHPEFSPSDSISGDTHVTLTFSLNVLIEVFKALFMNVYAHSKQNKPCIEVKIDASVASSLKVTFCSSCGEIDVAEEAARVTSLKISSGEYENSLSTEGGSGLPKIARATISGGLPNMKVWVDGENALFCVEMKFSLINL